MILLILLALLVIGVFHQFYWRRRNFPPGPMPLPLIGNLHTMAKYEPGYGAFEMWKKQYGDMFTYWLGPYPFIVIADYDLMKETFIRDGDAYAGKFQMAASIEKYRGGAYGVVDTNGPMWREHRRFALHQLRDFGVGKDLMQLKILLEVDETSKRLRRFPKGEEVNIQDEWSVAVGNVINQIVFGHRFDEDKLDEFLRLKTLLTEQLLLFSRPAVIACSLFPSSKHVFTFSKNIWDKVYYYRDETFAFFKEQLRIHREQIDFDVDDNKDYVEAFLKEQRKREQAGDKETYCDLQLVNMVFDMWIAGMETTSNTLSWAVAYAINFPEAQEKLHEELSRVINSDREITVQDKNDLVYVNAFVNETQRMANLLPMNLPHVLTRDVQIRGYTFTEGTGVLAQISTVMYDEKVFPNPNVFNPSRFIDESGQLKKVEELVPFSVGKRQCLGEGLARMELFLFTANIFNRFKFSAGIGGPPCLKKKFSTTVHPEKYTCHVESRF